ncbi:MAG: tryptophan-rich sensory protein [Actinomycetota bacterium]
MTESNGRVLVTGVTGYIGGLLVPALLEKGRTVRVLGRSEAKLRRQPWFDRVEVALGSATEADVLASALDGVEVAYYLLHSMDGKGDFVERDRRMAEGFAAAARDAGVRRIVYLSGLHPDGELSPHLASRVEVGEILLASGVPTAVLQAGVVLGAGSASFDMLRHLTERLPVMVAPKWLHNRIQPIAIQDVLHYLVAAADLPPDVNRSYDVGGPDVLTYADMMRRYAEVTGLGGRFIRTVPVLTPELASHWVGLVTPVLSGVARPLVGSLIHDAVCHENDATRELGLPPGGLKGYDVAIRAAVGEIDPQLWRRTFRRVGAAVAATAVAGSVLSDPDSRWYRGLAKPPWQPPAATFPIVWTTLYGIIAMASTTTIAELTEKGEAGEAEAYWAALGANLALNAGWSGVFFRAQNPLAGTVVAGVLTASSADLARRGSAAGPGKAIGLGLYAAWCGFATALSGSVARRNPGA